MNEPKIKWPGWEDANHALTEPPFRSYIGRRGDAGLFVVGYMAGVGECMDRFHAAAHDDPHADLPGAVRKSPDGALVVKRHCCDYGRCFGWAWAPIAPNRLCQEDVPEMGGISNEAVKGWPVIGSVPGTPTAEAQTK